VLTLLATAGGMTLACSRAEEYAMGSPIDMGPYTFVVTGAASGRSWESAEGRYHEISVAFRLDRDDSPPFTTDFTSSFLDKMTIVDAAGNQVQTHPVAVDPSYKGGRSRSGRYTSLFRYSRSSPGMRDFAAVGTRPEDFRLLIDNPAPEPGQPRQVVVPLR